MILSERDLRKECASSGVEIHHQTPLATIIQRIWDNANGRSNWIDVLNRRAARGDWNTERGDR